MVLEKEESDLSLKQESSPAKLPCLDGLQAGPLSWVRVLAKIFDPFLAKLGQQARTMRVETLCSGTGSPTYGLSVCSLA